MRHRLRRGHGRAGPYPTGSLTRTLIDLALASGIAPSVWAAEIEDDERVLVTAIDLLRKHHRKHGNQRPDGVVTSG